MYKMILSLVPLLTPLSPQVAHLYAIVGCFLPLPTLVLTYYRNHPMYLSPASRTFVALHPPSPTQSAHSLSGTSAGPRDIDTEVHDSPSSSGFLSPPTGGYTLPVSNISNGTDRDVNGSASFGLPSSVASFITRIVRCVYYPSPSPSGDTDMGSDITRNDSFLEGDNGVVRLDSATANSNVDLHAFKPLELVALVDHKSLDNLESLGGVEGLLYGLGTNRRRGLKTTRRSRSPDPPAGIREISAVSPFGVELALMPPFGGAFGVDSSTPLENSISHEATIEDRQRTYRHNMPLRRPSKRLLFFMWLALYDKVIVSLKTLNTISLELIGASGFFVDRCRIISCP